MIDWAAHEVSFKRLTRNGKIHTAKLIHQLVNTNIQNQLYFGTSPLCPCCLSAEETFSPNTCCPAPSAAAHRSSAFQLLLDDLKKVQTPQEILDAISHGQTLWRSHTATPARALTFGSLKAPDIVLTAAFTEQCHIIGWLHFLLGCMWSSALLHYRKQSQDQVIGTRWASFLVSAEWKFTRSLWAHRNLVLHGATVEETVQRQVQKLHGQVQSLYQQYLQDNSIVLPRHSYLFTSKTLQQRLDMPYDDIQCWLRSVAEAKSILQTQTESLHRQFRQFFPASSHTTLSSSSTTTDR
jgi:hypothetical protein